MPRETFILTQDIADGQLIDTHPAPGSRMQKLVDKTILDIFTVLNATVPVTSTTKRLDSELNSLSPAVGAGLGVLTTRKHQVFKVGTDHAFIDGATIEINADLAYTAPVSFSISMSFNTALGTTFGVLGDVQVGDFVTIATPVPFYAQILAKVPNGPDFDLTFSSNFVGGPTGPYLATRVARWLATFKDSTDSPFPMPGDNVDFGILQRAYLADLTEEGIVGPHPEFAPDVAGGGGGGGTITGGGTVGKLSKFTGATAIGDSVVEEAGGNIGIGIAPGAFKLNVNGPTRIDGKLTVTGALDPTSLLLSDPASGTELFIESNDGATAPVSGAATGRIRYNNTTGRWQLSAQGVAYKNFQTVENDIFAATRVVDPSGNGTDTTIAAAIAALPATGGTIFLKQGVYTITATLVLPGSKNVLIKGAGKGATVLNLTTAAIPLFQIGAAATGKYALRDFSVTGDGATAQKFIDLASVVDVVVVSVDVTDLRDIVNDSAGAEVVFQNCAFWMPFLGGCSFWRGTGPAGTLVWIYTEATLQTAASGAIVGSPEWDVTDSYIGGPGASFYACGKIIWQTFRLDNAEVTVSVGDSRIDECDFVNAGVIFTSTSNVVGDSVFTGGSPSSFLSLRFGGVGNVVTGNTFNGGIATAIDILVAATETVISGNRFFPSYFSCVKNASSNAVVSGNSGIQVIESGAANNNRYTGNTEFAASTILGADCVVEGVRRKDVVGGATVDALVDQFTHANTKGLTGGGSIKNTGGSNSLTVRLTAIDVYGTTDTQDTVVPSGGSAVWSMANAVGTALPPFVSYKVSVKSTTPGLPTTFTLHHATSGAY